MNRPGRASREQAEFEKFHYLGTETLRNKFGLRDPHRLELAERYLSAVRAKQGLPGDARRVEVDGLRAIHHHLFQDVYDWAGNFRTYTTGRGAAPFATPENIRPWLQKQFADLRDENGLKGLEANRFAARAAHYVNKIMPRIPLLTAMDGYNAPGYGI